LFDILCDGVKRCALAHILKYSENLSVNIVELHLCDAKGNFIESQDVTRFFELHSLIPTGKIQGISKELQTPDAIRKIATIKKSEQGNSTAAVYAYLYAKTCKKEVEKFTYIWMSFNGYYNKISKEKSKDYIKIDDVLDSLGYSYRIMTRNERDSIFKKIMLISAKHTENMMTKEGLLNNPAVEAEASNLYCSIGKTWQHEFLYPFLLQIFLMQSVVICFMQTALFYCSR